MNTDESLAVLQDTLVRDDFDSAIQMLGGFDLVLWLARFFRRILSEAGAQRQLM